MDKEEIMSWNRTYHEGYGYELFEPVWECLHLTKENVIDFAEQRAMDALAAGNINCIEAWFDSIRDFECEVSSDGRYPGPTPTHIFNEVWRWHEQYHKGEVEDYCPCGCCD
jgi:hypothetical protein